MVKTIDLNLYKNNIIEKTYKNIKCLDKSNLIFYIDKVKTSLDNKVFIRENNEYRFEIDLKNKKSYYLLKSNNLIFDIDVEYTNYKEEKNKIIIEYKISTEEETIKIEIIERNN